MTFAESLAFILIAAVAAGLVVLAVRRLTASPAPSERCHEPDELMARIAAWRKRTGATEAPSFPLFEDDDALPACFQCLSEETPRQAPAIAGNGPSAVQWADTPAYRGVERRQQSRGGLRPVWTAAQRRLVEEDWTGTAERYLESSEGDEAE